MLYTVIYSSWVILIYEAKAGKGTDKGSVAPVHVMNADGWKRGITPAILDLST
jgi:hypothetical protein